MANLYPDNWSDIAIAVKQEARWRCQKCGLKCIAPNEDTSKLSRSHSWRNTYGTLRASAARLPRMAYTLQVHHWDRNPANNHRDNLIALCSSCHLGYHQGGKSNVSPGQLSLW